MKNEEFATAFVFFVLFRQIFLSIRRKYVNLQPNLREWRVCALPLLYIKVREPYYISIACQQIDSYGFSISHLHLKKRTNNITNKIIKNAYEKITMVGTILPSPLAALPPIFPNGLVATPHQTQTSAYSLT